MICVVVGWLQSREAMRSCARAYYREMYEYASQLGIAISFRKNRGGRTHQLFANALLLISLRSKGHRIQGVDPGDCIYGPNPEIRDAFSRHLNPNITTTHDIIAGAYRMDSPYSTAFSLFCYSKFCICEVLTFRRTYILLTWAFHVG